MRLLFIDDRLPFYLGDPNYPVGGASIRVFALANGLTQLGHDVGILTWIGANKQVGKKYAFDLVESYQLNNGLKGIRFFSRRHKMYKSIKAFNPDYTFQISAAVNTGVMGFISKLLKIPYVYLAASNADADGKYANYLKKSEQSIYRYGLKKSSMIITQNQYQFDHFRKDYPEKTISTIHNPFYYQGKLPKIVPASKRKYIAWVGNFAKVKNVPAAYKIIAELQEYNFKLAGGKTNKTDQEALDVLQKLEQLPNVEFVGHLSRKEVLPFLSNAFALFNTSHLEGFSNTFLESLAVGTPVVTRHDIDPDNILQNNGLGEIVTSNDEIPQAIRKIMNHEHFDELAHRCRAYIIKNHDVEVIANTLIEKLKLVE